MNSVTPLSDCITAIVAGPTYAKWEALMSELSSARLGVVATGAPPGASGTYQARRDEVGLSKTRTPDGRLLILACADPTVFRQRFPTQPFNADMDAPSVFR